MSNEHADNLNSSGKWKRCAICGDRSARPIRAALWHLRPINPDFWENRRYLRGNIKTFGFWSGLRAYITLQSPLLNTLVHWKYRKSHLEIEEIVCPITE